MGGERTSSESYSKFASAGTNAEVGDAAVLVLGATAELIRPVLAGLGVDRRGPYYPTA